jgi:hypothetical protein
MDSGGLPRDIFGALLLPRSLNSILPSPHLPRSSTATPPARYPYPPGHSPAHRAPSCRDKCTRVRSPFAPRLKRHLRSSTQSASMRGSGDVRRPPPYPECAGQCHQLNGLLPRSSHRAGPQPTRSSRRAYPQPTRRASSPPPRPPSPSLTTTHRVRDGRPENEPPSAVPLRPSHQSTA